MPILTKILNRFTGSLIFEAEVEGSSESIRLGLVLKLAYNAKADLRRANLLGADLSRANLSRADLSGANLSRANLQEADLSGANLLGGIRLAGKRPIIQIGPIGSRVAYLCAYITDKGLYFQTGCFFGDLVQFRAAIAETHDSNLYATEYEAALHLILKHSELWGPEEQESAEKEAKTA